MEVVVAMTVLSIAFLAFIEFTNLMNRQLATAQQKQENLGKLDLIQKTFAGPVQSGEYFKHPLSLTFKDGLYSGLTEQKFYPKNSNANYLFPEGLQGPSIHVVKVTDFDLSSMVLAKWSPHELFLAWLESTIPPTFAAGGPAPGTAPPPYGAVRLEWNVHFPVAGVTAPQIVRNAGSAVFTFGQSGSDWAILLGYNDGMIKALKMECDAKGPAYALKTISDGGVAKKDFEFQCLEMASCPSGTFKMESGFCVNTTGPTNVPLVGARCLNTTVYENSNIGRQSFCQQNGLNARNLILAPNAAAGTFCADSLIYNRETQTCEIP